MLTDREFTYRMPRIIQLGYASMGLAALAFSGLCAVVVVLNGLGLYTPSTLVPVCFAIGIWLLLIGLMALGFYGFFCHDFIR